MDHVGYGLDWIGYGLDWIVGASMPCAEDGRVLGICIHTDVWLLLYILHSPSRLAWIGSERRMD